MTYNSCEAKLLIVLEFSCWESTTLHRMKIDPKISKMIQTSHKSTVPDSLGMNQHTTMNPIYLCCEKNTWRFQLPNSGTPHMIARSICSFSFCRSQVYRSSLGTCQQANRGAGLTGPCPNFGAFSCQKLIIPPVNVYIAMENHHLHIPYQWAMFSS